MTDLEKASRAAGDKTPKPRSIASMNGATTTPPKETGSETGRDMLACRSPRKP